MKTVESMAELLVQLEIRHAFGVSGATIFHLGETLAARGVTYIANRHEAAAVSAADAYARAHGGVGIALVHAGAGLTNTLTSIGEAAKSGVPVLILAGAPPQKDLRANVRIDQDAVVSGVYGVSEWVYSAESATADLMRAYTTALLRRCPVVLNIPTDIQREPSPSDMPDARVVISESPAPSPHGVAVLAEALTSAQRPIFLAGAGARHSDAATELSILAERCGALMATSVLAKGLFAKDAWNIDVAGGFSSPEAASLISDADLIVAWGCSLTGWTTKNGTLFSADARVLHVDTDPIGYDTHERILGDVKHTAHSVNTTLQEKNYSAKGYRSADVEERIAHGVRWRDVPYTDTSDEQRIDPRTLTIRLDDMLPAHRAVAIDGGNFIGYPSMFLSGPDAKAFCLSGLASQAIGLGLAGAIGTHLALPDRLTVAALGDGGCMMSTTELETVVRLRLPLLIVVYNDNAYGAEIHQFAAPGEETATATFPDTNIAEIARGFGCEAITVRNLDDLQPLHEWLKTPDERGPLLIDAKISSDGGSWFLRK